MVYKRGTVAEYFSNIASPDDFRICMGDFLDDFYSADNDERLRMVWTPIDLRKAANNRRYAAFFAAMTEHLCWRYEIECPLWTQEAIYRLPTPWFLHENWRFRAWQLTMTPPAFKSRNIFGGDDLLSRV